MKSTIMLLLAAVFLHGEDIALQKIDFNDGRSMLGKYDKDKGSLALCDEKTGKIIATIPVKSEDIKAVTDVKVTTKESDPLDKRGINGKWITNYEAALKLAAETHRPILAVLTGSDWCPWCVKLEKEMFSTQKFKDWAKDNVVLLYLDFPQNKKLSKEQEKQNRELQEKWGKGGYPTLYLISEKGDKYDWKHGYSDEGLDTWLAYLDFSKKKLTK
jgi:protein disulfide-isomerase